MLMSEVRKYAICTVYDIKKYQVHYTLLPPPHPPLSSACCLLSACLACLPVVVCYLAGHLRITGEKTKYIQRVHPTVGKLLIDRIIGNYNTYQVYAIYLLVKWALIGDLVFECEPLSPPKAFLRDFFTVNRSQGLRRSAPPCAACVVRAVIIPLALPRISWTSESTNRAYPQFVCVPTFSATQCSDVTSLATGYCCSRR